MYYPAPVSDLIEAMGKMKRFNNARILIYCHDTLGLGHLRRCRTIAQSLVGEYKGLSVLIVSGSPIIGAYEFRTRVDFVRVPGVIKLRNGDYSSLSLDLDIGQVVELRASIIRHTAAAFGPDLFIVDKEPLGFHGEISDTLEMLRARGVPTILGLRDVMDEPHLLAQEWSRKGLVSTLDDLYDAIWVYGLPQICDPLEGTGVSETVRQKMVYTGYLEARSSDEYGSGVHSELNSPYVLVTPGGGSDGDALIEWVLDAYEADPGIPYSALMLFGPFMAKERRAAYTERAERIPKIMTATFESQIEKLIENAHGMVTMGGYNTFCEILSFDKPALIVPRTQPRLEQFIRACRAEELGLVKVLSADNRHKPQVMAEALRNLDSQAKPSDAVVPGLLEGLPNINRLVTRWLDSVEEVPAKVTPLPLSNSS